MFALPRGENLTHLLLVFHIHLVRPSTLNLIQRDAKDSNPQARSGTGTSFPLGAQPEISEASLAQQSPCPAPARRIIEPRVLILWEGWPHAKCKRVDKSISRE